MNNQEYVAGALRTEAPITPDMVGRFLQPGTVVLLREAMLKCIEEGNNLDLLKRHLFYGKTIFLPESDRLAPSIADRLRNPKTIRLLHAAIGFATEAAETLKALHDYIYTEEGLDVVNLVEEKGDRFWYEAIEADALGVTFEDAMRINNHKLRTRFPDKFTQDQALTRDLISEREILESKQPIPEELVTVGGLRAKVFSYDMEHGYAHGTVERTNGTQTWAWPNGKHIGPEANAGLDLTSFEVPA
jgi:hypothetical protein